MSWLRTFAAAGQKERERLVAELAAPAVNVPPSEEAFSPGRPSPDRTNGKGGRRSWPHLVPRYGPPSPIKIGYFLNRATGEVGPPNLFEGERHVLLFGLNGAGKSTRLLIELLMTATGRSLVVYDVKGELAAQTAAERRKHGRVVILNPFNLHVERYPDLAGDVFNPLEFIDPDGPNFYRDAAALAHALIEVSPNETQKHWPESAQGLWIAVICWECILAKREDRPPSLAHCRSMMTEPEEWEKPGGKGCLLRGFKLTIARMIDEGGPMLAGLVGELVREHGLGEIASIGSAAKNPTRWLVDPLMAASLEGRGVDFRALRDEPTTVFVILPAGDMTEFRPWSRMVMSTALRAQYRPGRIGTLFVLDEFFAALGHMKVIEDAWALVRGYGIQLMPIVQSALQLKSLFNDAWENFAGQAGAVITLGPPGDLFTARWMSERSAKTTILQMGFNQGQGINSGHGFNTGIGVGGGVNSGVSANTGQGLNFGGNMSDGLSYQQTERPVLLPQELMDLEAGTGLIWLPGMGTRCIPFFAPNYWKRREPWVAQVRPNPDRQG